MKIQSEEQLKTKIRFWTALFIALLVLSGITAFPIETQLSIAVDHLSFVPDYLRDWITQVYSAVATTNKKYPFLSYGTDWLAFAHLVIAVAFIGPYRDPVRNIWIFQFGMIACFMVIPLALIAGTIREIPYFWRLIDCSFGVLGAIPLYLCYKSTKQLEYIQLSKNNRE